MADEGLTKIGMQPPHPGAFIKTEVLDELHLSISEAARRLNVRRATLSDLIHGKVSLTPAMALRLEQVLHLSMDTLLQMQVWHDSYMLRQRVAEVVRP